MITPSEICILLHMIRKPNSIIVLLFIENISNFLTSLPFRRLSSNSRTVSGHKTTVLSDTPQKVYNINWAIYFAYSCIPFAQLVSNLTISSSDSFESLLIFLVQSGINSYAASPGNEADRWWPSNRFYCSLLPNMVKASWLWRISWGIEANQKRLNILNEW